MECLDDRIVPSTMHAAVGVSADAVAAISGAQRHENRLASLEVKRGMAAITVTQRHENRLARLELRHERRVAHRDLVLARRRARFLANHPSTITPTSPTTAGPLPLNVSSPLQALYTQYAAYESAGASGTFTPTEVGANLLVISGTSVGIQVKDTATGNFNTLTIELQNAGMQIVESDATYGLIEGMLPIAQLPTVAQLPQTQSITPMIRAISAVVV
jgi:hypothetical protein